MYILRNFFNAGRTFYFKMLYFSLIGLTFFNVVSTNILNYPTKLKTKEYRNYTMDGQQYLHRYTYVHRSLHSNFNFVSKYVGGKLAMQLKPKK
jgi:hypothetical protein